MPPCCRCYRRKVHMYERDEHVYCASCMLKALVAERLISVVEPERTLNPSAR